jgi:hypothetical protein
MTASTVLGLGDALAVTWKRFHLASRDLSLVDNLLAEHREMVNRLMDCEPAVYRDKLASLQGQIACDRESLKDAIIWIRLAVKLQPEPKPPLNNNPYLHITFPAWEQQIKWLNYWLITRQALLADFRFSNDEVMRSSFLNAESLNELPEAEALLGWVNWVEQSKPKTPTKKRNTFTHSPEAKSAIIEKWLRAKRVGTL